MSKHKKNKTQKIKKMDPSVSLSSPVHNFTQEEYNSNDGMLTTVWGPGTWHFLHTMSFNYPIHPTETDKTHYMEFVRSLQYVLPCGKCRKNLKKNFAKLPLRRCDMENREKFSTYIYNLHETINKMLNKKSCLSYEDVRQRYEHFRSRCTTMKKKVKKGKKDHKGCTAPLYGEKSKCVLHIVPQTEKCPSFQVDDKCMKKDYINI